MRLIAAVHLSFKISKQIAPVYRFKNHSFLYLTTNVWMINARHEFDNRRRKGIVILQMNKQFEVSALKRRIRWASDETIKTPMIWESIIDTQLCIGVLYINQSKESYRRQF